MKKSVLLCLFIGVSLGIYMYSRYDQKELNLVSLTDKKIYLFQYGVYDNKNSLEKIKIKHITNLENNKYYVYVAATTKKANVEKLENYFKKQNINVYVKEIIIDYELYDVLKQYDLLLDEAETDTSIKTIIETVLTKYEENNGQNKRNAT